jgi:glycosyltransferase involved in cell wall biosynthesis
VVPPRDPPALAAALNRVLADPALGARLGAAGRTRVLSTFTQAQMLARIEDVYHAVLAKKTP